MIKIQEIVIGGVTYVPFGENVHSCFECAFYGKGCGIVSFDVNLCDLFEGRRLKIKENNYGKND